MSHSLTSSSGIVPSELTEVAAANSAQKSPVAKALASGKLLSLLTGVVLLMSTAGIYLRTLEYPWQFDDFMYLRGNPLMTNVEAFGPVTNLQDFVDSPLRHGYDPDLATNLFMRPFAYLTFRLNWMLDGFNPTWYRAVNIAVHALNGLLIFALINGLASRSPWASSMDGGVKAFLAAGVALVFAVHPLATESVTYIVQRFTSMGTMFFLLSLWLHFVAVGTSTLLKRRLLQCGAFSAMLAGMWTKECVFTAPGMIVILDVLLLGTGWKMAFKRSAYLLILLPLIPCEVLLLGWARNDGGFSLDKAMNLTNRVEEPLHHWHFLVTELTVMQEYVKKLLVPAGLNIDPEWPLYDSIFDRNVILAAGFLLTICSIPVAYFLRNRESLAARLMLAGVVWFFVTIFVSSGLIPLPDLMADHRTYLPSAGAFLAILCGFVVVLEKVVVRSMRLRIAWVLLMVAAAVLTLATLERNKVWSSSLSLWRDTAAMSPGKFRVQGNLGASLLNEGRPAEAIAPLLKSVELEPEFGAGYLNLARAYNRTGRYQEAFDLVARWEQVKHPKPVSVDMVFEAATAQLALGNTPNGLRMLNKIIVEAPSFRPAHLLLGMVYTAEEQPQQAIYHFQRAESLSPLEPPVMEWVKKSQQMLASAGAQ